MGDTFRLGSGTRSHLVTAAAEGSPHDLPVGFVVALVLLVIGTAVGVALGLRTRGRTRHRGLQIAIGALMLVVGMLGVLGAVGGASYAIIGDHVSVGEATVAGSIGIAASLVVIVPAALTLARSTAATVFVGIVAPLAGFAATRWFLPDFNLGLEAIVVGLASLVILTPSALTLRWLVSSAPSGDARPPTTAAPVTMAATRGDAPSLSIPQGTYHVVALGHEYGPYDATRLVELARAGQVSPTARLRFDGGEPFPATELPGLFR